MPKRLRLAILAALLALASTAASAVAIAVAAPLLQLLGRTELPDYSGDFDHMAADIRGNRLFMAAEDHGTLEVFNLNTGARERTLTTFGTPHGILFLRRANRLIVSDSGNAGTVILDASTYKVVGHIKLAPGADSMTYDAPSHRLYIVTGGSDVGMKDCFLNEVDPLTGHIYAQHRFDSDHTEAVAIEPHGRRLFVNIADHDYVAVLDKVTLKELARWPLTGARLNLSMALDARHHRLFVVTRNPSKLFVLDTGSGRTIAVMDAPAIADGVFYDSARQRIYVPGGIGDVGVYQQVDPDHYTRLADVPSARGAKSGVLVPEIDRLFLAVSPGAQGHSGALLRFALPPVR